MKKYSKEEKKEILKKLKNKPGFETIESLGHNRYRIREKYQVILENGATTWLHKYRLFDEEGTEIPLAKNYDGIFSFARGAASVCIRKNTKIIETSTGTKFSQERKDGLIDVNGKELLPCIYDSVSVKLDGFVEIIKDGTKKATNVNQIVSGKFDWNKADEWD